MAVAVAVAVGVAVASGSGVGVAVGVAVAVAVAVGVAVASGSGVGVAVGVAVAVAVGVAVAVAVPVAVSVAVASAGDVCVAAGALANISAANAIMRTGAISVEIRRKSKNIRNIVNIPLKFRFGGILTQRLKEKRNNLWVWKAVVKERDGSKWMDFEMSGRDEAALLRLLERLPEAERHETDAYGVYGRCPSNKHAVGKYGR